MFGSIPTEPTKFMKTKKLSKIEKELLVCIEVARESIRSGKAYMSLLNLIKNSGGKISRRDKKWIEKHNEL